MWLDPGLAPTFLPWSGLVLFSDWLMSLRLELWLVPGLWCQGRVRPQATHTAALRRIIRAWDAEWCDAFLDSSNARQIFERAAHFLSEIEDDRDNRWGWIVSSPSSATPPEDSYKIIPRHRHTEAGSSGWGVRRATLGSLCFIFIIVTLHNAHHTSRYPKGMFLSLCEADTLVSHHPSNVPTCQ